MDIKDKQAIVFDFGRFRNTDGEGIRTMIFFKGCPLRCKWCANPWGLSVRPQLAVNRDRCTGCETCVRVCPHGVNSIDDDGKVRVDFSKCENCGLCVLPCPAKCRQISGSSYTARELFDRVYRDLTFTRRGKSGITLSGGELLMQWEVASEVLRLCKVNYIDTCIETSGFAPWDHLKAVAQYCDSAFIDLKHMDSARHKEICGVPNERILENIRRLSDYMHERGKYIIVRHAVIPGMNDDEDNWREMAKYMATLPGLPELNVLPYHNLGELKYEMIGQEAGVTGLDMMKKSDERIERIAKLMAEYAPDTPLTIGGENAGQRPE
ncbi:MAG: glycyl-radical enzyme activating protein [Atopobiaceae bacterium]|nr:glycyl-radical enzyme activating protein [Atopobiaceae bacterium]